MILLYFRCFTLESRSFTKDRFGFPSITQHPINSVIRKYKGQIVGVIVQSEMHLMYIIFISAILFVFFHCLKVISVVHYPTQKEHISKVMHGYQYIDGK